MVEKCPLLVIQLWLAEAWKSDIPYSLCFTEMSACSDEENDEVAGYEYLREMIVHSFTQRFGLNRSEVLTLS